MNTSVKIDNKMGLGIRIYNIIIGLILFLATGYVLLFPQIDDITVIIFAAIICLMGLSRLFNGLFDRGLKNVTKITKIVVGFVLTALGILIYFAPTFGEDFLTIFLSIALIINGITRIFVSSVKKSMAKHVRILMIVLGSIMVLLAAFVLVAYFVGGVLAFDDTLYIGILAITTQLSGVSRLIAGITGFRVTSRLTEEEFQRKKEEQKQKKKEEKLEKKLRKEKRKND